MLRTFRSRLTYANIVATLALVVALSGGAYAAAALPRNSVGAKQLRNNAVTRVKIKNRAVSGAKIAANAVTGYHVVESTLGAVPEATHAASADSAKTATAATTAGNAALSRLDYESTTIDVPSGSPTAVTASASCPAGLYATGGGARVGDDGNAYVNDAGPSSRTTWEGSAWPYSGPGSTLTVYVICAPAAAVTP
jgi:hypothetical protein